MKIDKYILLGEQANRKVCVRMGIDNVNHHEQAVLVLLRRRGMMRFGHFTSAMSRYGKSADPTYISKSLHKLLSLGFIVHEGVFYSLSHLGREYLSYYRNYLRNYRL